MKIQRASSAPFAESTQGRVSPAKSRYPLAVWLGVCLPLVYFVRGSMLSWVLPIPNIGWIALTGTLLLCASVISVAAGKGISGAWTWVLMAFSLSIFASLNPKQSLLQLVGIVMLVMSVGPMINNEISRAIRTRAWRMTENGMALLTVVLGFWYLLRLPSHSFAPFTGFMIQSMLAGPIAGLGCLIMLIKAIHKKSWIWAGMAVFGGIPLIAAATRVSLLGTGLAASFLLMRRKPILGILFAIAIGTAILTFVKKDSAGSEGRSITSALYVKGIQNTRSGLWQARIEEFKSSPLVGIGVAMGLGEGAILHESGEIKVEPGSSYLAILAMTGLLGFFTFFGALFYELMRFVTSKNIHPLNHDILCCVGIFLGVNAIAEGWILGFGSQLCFLFWLWLGRVADVSASFGTGECVSGRRPLHPARGRGISLLHRGMKGGG